MRVEEEMLIDSDLKRIADCQVLSSGHWIHWNFSDLKLFSLQIKGGKETEGDGIAWSLEWKYGKLEYNFCAQN